jgi:hypothetical protein
MADIVKKLIVVVLIGLLSACSGQKPPVTPVKIAAKPKPRYMNAMNLPPALRMTGQRTVAEVLEVLGPYAEHKLSPYFAKAHVDYPPSQVAFLALKDEKKFELWARDTGEYRLIRSYDIQAASGFAGPKLRQGDKQVPEGVYRIVGLNPNSNYHLSMKINYPNEFDLFHAQQEGRFQPGSDIFIHGKAASIGCLAMGDEAIEELFVLAAQVGKENIKVVIAPHDPRKQPLPAMVDGLPAWAGELYSTINSEVQELTRQPISVSRSDSYPSRP